MKAVYGPVSSWRLGRSLGIDMICSAEKVCPFDCSYCQLGSGVKTYERREFISMGKLKKDAELIGAAEADVVTFSGTGEPTLAANLGYAIEHIRSICELPLAILTNASLLWDAGVRESLYGLDIVVAKLDAPNEHVFREINRPHDRITFERYLKGLLAFRDGYPGRFALQTMFTEANKGDASEIAELARELDPDEIQINTPLRPCRVKPLSVEEMAGLKEIFIGIGNVTSVYDADAKKPQVNPLDADEVRKRKRPEP